MGFYPITVAVLLLCAGHFFKTIGLANRGAEFWQRLKAEFGEQHQLDTEFSAEGPQPVPALNEHPYGSNHQPEDSEPEQHPPYPPFHENADMNDGSLEATPAERIRASPGTTLRVFIPRSAIRPVGPDGNICARRD